MLPKIISIGDFFLPAYGLLVAAGFLTALWVAGRLARQSGIDPEAVSALGVNAALAGLVGAKLFLLVADFDYYSRNPGEIFSWTTVQAGGIFFGGLIAALALSFWYIRRRQLPLLPTLDAFAPAIALGHAIGRLGCFAAGCCWGLACDRPWAVTFTSAEAHRLVGVPIGVPLHPTQLYEAASQVVVFAVALAVFRRPHPPGRVIAVYLVLSSLSRFIIDFFRAHDQPNPGNGALSMAQWISLGLLLAGGVLWYRSSRVVSGSSEAARLNN